MTPAERARAVFGSLSDSAIFDALAAAYGREDQLVAVLRFYAQPLNHKSGAIWMDGGDLARATLAEIGAP